MLFSAVWHLATITDQWLRPVWITHTCCPAAAVCQQQQHSCKTNIDANLTRARKPIYFSFTEQMKAHLSLNRTVRVNIFSFILLKFNLVGGKPFTFKVYINIDSDSVSKYDLI